MCKLGGIEKCYESRFVVSETKNKKIFCFHDWYIDKDNGFTQYRKCLKCGKKEILQPECEYPRCGYYEIDLGYLKEQQQC